MIAITWLRDYFQGKTSINKIDPKKKSNPINSKEEQSINNNLINIINIYDQARSCEACFEDTPKNDRAGIFGGQPRWIGKHYFDNTFSCEDYPRILVLLLRPGQLGGRSKDFDFERYDSLMENMIDANSWNDLMELIQADSKHWGRFDRMYQHTMNLDKDFTAFLNIGLCAGLESGDNVSLLRCFEKYSRSLLELFQPNVLLLNGQKVQKFYESYVSNASYVKSKKIIEKNLITKQEKHTLTEPKGTIFLGKPLKVQSYAARSSDFSYEDKLGWEIRYLYPPFNGAKEKRVTLENSKQQTSKSNPPWHENEIIIALDFYYDHRLNIPNKKSSEIRALSKLIRDLKIHPSDNLSSTFRNENGVYLKLMNFMSLDDKNIGRGMSNASLSDEKIWDRFYENPEELKKLAKKIIQHRKFIIDNGL